MLALVILAVSALLTTLLLTPICRAACRRLGWIDHPDPRKVHRDPIPRAGGIVIFFAYAAALALVRLSPLWASFSVTWSPLVVRALIPAVLVAFATGLFDDICNLNAWVKLTGQILAALLACVYAHVEITHIGGAHLPGVWLRYLLTILWLVGCANAFNLIDGLDGLATGIGLFATATAFVSALLSSNLALAFVTAPLLGALLGFLPYNFNPASIFMGDCGSNTVGFLLGCFAILWSQKSATLLGMTAPLIALAIPLLDTVLAVARRFVRQQHIFGADRRHIHHRLLSRGLTPRRVVYVLYTVAGLCACTSIVLTTGVFSRGPILILSCLMVWLAVQYLGYEEFDSARRVVFGGVLRRALSTDLTIRQLDVAIASARSVDECWQAVEATSRELGLSVVTLRTHGREFTFQQSHNGNGADYWSLSVPLNGSGTVDLCVPFSAKGPPANIAPLAAALRNSLAPKLEALRPKTLAAGAAPG